MAVSESTPGPIGVNMATYVGFTTAGVLGATIATLGLVVPSIVVILLIAKFLQNFQENRFVKSAFSCLRPVSVGLIATSGLSVIMIAFFEAEKTTESIFSAVNWKAVVLAAVLLLLTCGIRQTKKLHPVIWILVSAVVGVVFQFS